MYVKTGNSDDFVSLCVPKYFDNSHKTEAEQVKCIRMKALAFPL